MRKSLPPVTPEHSERLARAPSDFDRWGRREPTLQGGARVGTNAGADSGGHPGAAAREGAQAAAAFAPMKAEARTWEPYRMSWSVEPLATSDAPAVAPENRPAPANARKPSLARRFRRLVRSAIDDRLLPFAYASGALHLARRYLDRKTLTVAMFHRVLPKDSEAYRQSEREYALGPDEFDRCLAFFEKHYHPVSLAQVARAAAGQQTLPPHALLITFDDGWRDNVTHAEPLLKRRGLKATLFVNVEAVTQPGRRWWQDGLVEIAQKRPQALAQFGTRPDFFAVGRELLERPLDARLASMATWLDYDPAERQMLTTDEVRGLDRSVWEIGSHGLTHTPLTNVESVEDELVRSASELSRLTGEPITAISFPHGRYTRPMLPLAHATYPLVFSSDETLTRRDGTLGEVIGRFHLSSATSRDEASLALRLWCRKAR